MNNSLRNTAVLVAVAAMLPAAAHAQYYGGNYAQQPAPLYPYAVQVAPNMYEIRRPAATRAYPYVRGANSGGRNSDNPEPRARRFDRPPRPADRALIEELRKRSRAKGTVVNTTKIVRDPPVVIETKRYVDDPPHVIERQHVVEDAPAKPRRKHGVVELRETEKRPGRDDNKKRVIQADAEITILGPDRMSIRLFRKGHGGKANASAE